MKLTKNLIKQLINEAIAQQEAVLHGDFSKSGKAADVKPAPVSDFAAFKQKKMAGPSTPEGTEWLGDVAKLVNMILDAKTLDKLAEVDESMAEQMYDIANKLLPVVRTSITTLQDAPNDIEEAGNPKYDSWKKQHGEEGSKYIDSKGEEHDDPWDDEEREDPEPEDED